MKQNAMLFEVEKRSNNGETALKAGSSSNFPLISFAVNETIRSLSTQSSGFQFCSACSVFKINSALCGHVFTSLLYETSTIAKWKTPFYFD